ncbi:MAG TPA: efflux RND transporter periplasmic adaptor subunit [Candidatus Angelobacter sp.]|nr:efflux RND transporter periplasmic adaptor subunit [Candidatus Angelobacter sp.]
MAKNNNHSERNRLLGVIAALVAAVLLFSGWMKLHGGGGVAVRAEKIVRQDIANVISTNGKIEPLNNFEAHAAAPAIVKRVLVNEGDRVKAGQLLVQLDDAEARAQAARALAQLRSAEADLNAVHSGGSNDEVITNRSELEKARAERDEASRNLAATQHLLQTGAASPGEVQAARDRLQKADADVQLLQKKLDGGRFSSPEVAKVQAAVEQARAGYAAAQELLRNTSVHAPSAGTVYQVAVKQGAYVGGGQLLAQVANLDTVQVRAFVDEPEIGRLATGEDVVIKWDATPGRSWQGTLTRLPTVVTMVGTRTVGEITCSIPNSDHKLLPNVNVNVSIVTARRPAALTVSREALHEQDGKHYVYQIVDDKLRAQEIQTGISSLTRVEVVKGLTEGATVALGAIGTQPLRSGMEVKVVER